MPNFAFSEDQAVLACETEDRLKKLYIFEYQSGLWALSKTLDITQLQSVSSIKGQRDVFILRFSTDPMQIVEKKQDVWQISPFNRSQSSPESLQEIILINSTTALGLFSNKSQYTVSYLNRDQFNNNWQASQALAPHTVQFGQKVRNLQLIGDRLLIENGDGKKLRLELFKLENTGLFRHEQTVAVDGNITYYNAKVRMLGSNLIIARPYDDIAGSPRWSGRIDVYKPSATGQYSFTHSTGAGLLSQADLKLGASLAVSQNFIFALTNRAPSATHQGDRKKQIFVYKIAE
jgi:hypothetical protein